MAQSPETIGICAPDGQGILAKLSREIRDEIYRYLVKGRYVFAVPPCSTFVARFDATCDTGFDVGAADLSILRVSKSVGGEALALLYAESIFELCLDFVETGPYTQYAKEVTDRVMKVKCHIVDLGGRIPERLSGACLKNIEEFCETTIDHFTGTDITRNCMQIVFYPTADFRLSIAYMSSLFQSLRRLEGFRTVRVEFHSSSPVFERKDPQLARSLMDEVMGATKPHLEPALGPATSGYFGKPGGWDFYAYLTFHPHRHLVKRLGQEAKWQQRDA